MSREYTFRIIGDSAGVVSCNRPIDIGFVGEVRGVLNPSQDCRNPHAVSFSWCPTKWAWPEILAGFIRCFGDNAWRVLPAGRWAYHKFSKLPEPEETPAPAPLPAVTREWAAEVAAQACNTLVNRGIIGAMFRTEAEGVYVSAILHYGHLVEPPKPTDHSPSPPSAVPTLEKCREVAEFLDSRGHVLGLTRTVGELIHAELITQAAVQPPVTEGCTDTLPSQDGAGNARGPGG